jgi:predicted nuclease of restriction endonuclease-like (RecB) superfamily
MEALEHFEAIRLLISEGRAKVLRQAYSGQLQVYWNVGGYVHHRLLTGQYGDKIVDQLANWLKEKEPTLKGFDKRTIYRMRAFYTTWYSLDWDRLQKDGMVIVGSKIPQLQKMPAVLGKISWSHHLEILKRTSIIEEKVFYLLLSVKESYTLEELIRQIKSSLYERQKMSMQKILKEKHPGADRIPQIFRDKYIFEFLDLSEPYSENDLQKGLVTRLKQFILELGKDFIFMAEEFRVQVGMHDYYIDLLFFQRELQCMVAFEIKVTNFEPEFLGKLNFYLEALDRDVKKPHENPSI